MVDSKMNGYLPYAPSKEGIFQGNHGYSRHRPPHRMSSHYRPPSRGNPRANNCGPRNFSYSLRGHPNMSYSRSSMCQSQPHHPRYLPHTSTADGIRTPASSYGYSDTKDMSSAIKECVPVKPGMAQTSTEEIQMSESQSRMRQSSIAQPCQTQVSFARVGIEQQSMLRPRNMHFSTAQSETSKVQARMTQSLVEHICPPQMSMLQPYTSTAQSVTQTSMYQHSMPETLVVQPQMSFAPPRTEEDFVASSKRQRNMSEPSATQPSIASHRLEQVATKKASTSLHGQDHAVFQAPAQRSATYSRITTSPVIESRTAQMPTKRSSLEKTSVSQSKMGQTSLSLPQTSMPVVHSSPGGTKMSMSDPRIEHTSTAKTSVAPHKKQKCSQSNQVTAKSPDGSEKQPFLVQYPVSTLYNQQWKANCTATTVNGIYSKKVTNSLDHSNSDAQRYQPYPKVTRSEVNEQNHNPICTKATKEKSGVKFENFRKNRWDLKEQYVGKSLQQESAKCNKESESDYKIGVNFQETNQPGYNNNNTESYIQTKPNSISQFEINHSKTGENKIQIKPKLYSHFAYGNKDLCFPGNTSSNNELVNNRTPSYLQKMEMSNNFDYESKNSSSIIDNNLDDCASSDTDIRNIDHSDDDGHDDSDDDDEDELGNKDAAELLMSMSNRSIKISRLMEEQKRLMASLHVVKSTSLVLSHQNTGESVHF